MITGVAFGTLRANVAAVDVGGIIELAAGAEIVGLDGKRTGAPLAVLRRAPRRDPVIPHSASVAFRAYRVMLARLKRASNSQIRSDRKTAGRKRRNFGEKKKKNFRKGFFFLSFSIERDRSRSSGDTPNRVESDSVLPTMKFLQLEIGRGSIKRFAIDRSQSPLGFSRVLCRTDRRSEDYHF